MSRLAVSLAATFSLLLCSLAFSQTSGTTPASATGAALPGVPTGPRAPQAGTGRIRGRIVAAQTGTPLRRAQVTLGIPASPARSTLTDREGRVRVRPASRLRHHREFQEQLRRASESLTIREGETLTLDLKLSGL